MGIEYFLPCCELFFGPLAMAGEGGLLREELKWKGKILERALYAGQTNSKPSTGSYFLNAHLLNMLLLYHLQNVTLS